MTSRFFRKWHWHFIFLALMGLFTVGHAWAELPIKERVQSAFIIKFIRFIKWPPSAFESSPPALNIGIVGQGHMNRALKTFEGKIIQGKEVHIEPLTQADNLSRYHILVFSDSTQDSWKEWKARLKDRPVLTIADWDGFAESGGHINFTLPSGKVRFKINYDAAKRAGLKISARILQLAEIVSTQNP